MVVLCLGLPVTISSDLRTCRLVSEEVLSFAYIKVYVSNDVAYFFYHRGSRINHAMFCAQTVMVCRHHILISDHGSVCKSSNEHRQKLLMLPSLCPYCNAKTTVRYGQNTASSLRELTCEVSRIRVNTFSLPAGTQRLAYCIQHETTFYCACLDFKR